MRSCPVGDREGELKTYTCKCVSKAVADAAVEQADAFYVVGLIFSGFGVAIGLVQLLCCSYTYDFVKAWHTREWDLCPMACCGNLGGWLCVSNGETVEQERDRVYRESQPVRNHEAMMAQMRGPHMVTDNHPAAVLPMQAPVYHEGMSHVQQGVAVHSSGAEVPFDNIDTFAEVVEEFAPPAYDAAHAVDLEMSTEMVELEEIGGVDDYVQSSGVLIQESGHSFALSSQSEAHAEEEEEEAEDVSFGTPEASPTTTPRGTRVGDGSASSWHGSGEGTGSGAGSGGQARARVPPLQSDVARSLERRSQAAKIHATGNRLEGDEGHPVRSQEEEEKVPWGWCGASIWPEHDCLSQAWLIFWYAGAFAFFPVVIGGVLLAAHYSYETPGYWNGCGSY